MPCITRDEMNQSRPMPRIRVDLPELGEDRYVWVHGLTALELERLRSRFRGPNRDKLSQKFDGHLLVEVCRNDDGQPVFTLEDVDTLMTRHAGLVARIASVSTALDSGRMEAGELTKNSSPAIPAGE